jgi:hypothetical protein
MYPGNQLSANLGKVCNRLPFAAKLDFLTQFIGEMPKIE